MDNMERLEAADGLGDHCHHQGEAMRFCTMVSIVRTEREESPAELTLDLIGANVRVGKASA